MAKKYEGMDLEELDEDELEMLEEEEEDEKPKKKVAPKKKKVVKKPKIRYAAFQIPARTGIADTETGEAIAEGEFWIQTAIANIIERLERIEYKLGRIMED
jgi:hypothetical protein